MQLETLLQALGHPPQRIVGWESLNRQGEVSALAYDSRQIVTNGLFIAVAGTHTDGRRFLEDAAQRGAMAALGEEFSSIDGGEELPLGEMKDRMSTLPLPYIVVEDVRTALANLACAFYHYPANQLCTIGITGTDGKTTTANLINHLLETAGRRTGLMTTANFRLAGQEWENATRQSTLEALEVQQFLRRICDSGATHAVVEATSHGLELRRVHGCNFDVGVVTNITHEHLDFHKTLDAYRRSKARLFEMLDPERTKSIKSQPVAILNRDDSSYDILKPYCRVPILDYGIDAPAAVRAVDLQLRADGTSFRLILPNAERQIETRLVGRFNVSNCLAAIATAYSQGIAPDDIVRGLATARGVAGRMEHIDEGQPFSVIVDYAHTPDSLGKVLATLRPLTSGRMLTVFGSAGERDRQKRPIMGRIATQMSDFFVIADEDPREEDSHQILREIAAGAEAVGKREGQDFLCIADRTTAIATAFQHAQAGDTVLLAGKGHEQSIIIGRTKHAWDDRRVAREQLQKYTQEGR